VSSFLICFSFNYSIFFTFTKSRCFCESMKTFAIMSAILRVHQNLSWFNFICIQLDDVNISLIGFLIWTWADQLCVWRLLVHLCFYNTRWGWLWRYWSSLKINRKSKKSNRWSTNGMSSILNPLIYSLFMFSYTRYICFLIRSNKDSLIQWFNKYMYFLLAP
jgi:hypothetical protein